MAITTTDGRLYEWMTQIEALEQTMEDLYGPPGITPTLPDVTTPEGMLEAIDKETEKAYVNFAKVYGAYHNSVVDAYKLALPASLLDFYGIKRVGGKTILYNQLIQNGDFVDSTGWASWNANSSLSVADGIASITLNAGTGSAYNPAIALPSVKFIAGHKYFMSFDFKFPITGYAYLSKYGFPAISVSGEVAADTWGHFSLIKDGAADGSYNGYIGCNTGASIAIGQSVEFKNIQLIDLTLMFGSGNEPATPAEVKQMIGAGYHNYSPGSLMNIGVTEIVSKDSDDATLETYPIPDEVQALDGYGLSAGDVYNYIDYENKKFVQCVGAVDMGDLTFGYGPSVGWSATLPNVKDPADDDAVFNGISDNYTAVSRNTQASAFSGGTDAGMVSVSGGKVYVGTGDISIVPSGTLYYELDTPVETDISEYLTNTDIKVEAGGSLEFPNQNGNDYRIPVPVKVEYIGV